MLVVTAYVHRGTINKKELVKLQLLAPGLVTDGSNFYKYILIEIFSLFKSLFNEKFQSKMMT